MTVSQITLFIDIILAFAVGIFNGFALAYLWVYRHWFANSIKAEPFEVKRNRWIGEEDLDSINSELTNIHIKSEELYNQRKQLENDKKFLEMMLE